MPSLSTGSVNFPTIVYENHLALVETLIAAMNANQVKPEIEIFDLSHIYAARRLADRGPARRDARTCSSCWASRTRCPPTRRVLELLLGEAKRMFPRCTWMAAGIGRAQAAVMDWVLKRGGNAVRTGLEDNIRISHDRLARSNAELVSLAAEAIQRAGRKVASPAQARRILALRPE